MKICMRCKSRISDRYNICPECGATLPKHSLTDYELRQVMEHNKNKIRSTKIAAVMIIITGILMIAAAFFIMALAFDTELRFKIGELLYNMGLFE